MCGLAFSGKSTRAARVAQALSLDLVSYDAINAQRGFDSDKAIDDREWEKTSMMAAGSARGALANGRGVIVDDTFSHRLLLDRFRALAQAIGVPFTLLLVDTPLDVIEARIADNARTPRRGQIEPDVFAHHRERFQFPANDEEPVRLTNEVDLDRWLAGKRRDS